MNRIWLVARREFLTTVARKGFLIGLFLMPVLGILLAVAMPKFIGARTPKITGEVMVIDATQAVRPSLATMLAPEAIRARRAEARQRQMQQAVPGAQTAGMPDSDGPPPPQLTLVDPPAGAGVEAAKRWLVADTPGSRHLAVVVVDEDAVKRQPDHADFGSYQLYVAPGQSEALENALGEGMRLALVHARLVGSGLDPAAIEAAMRVSRPAATIVAREGEQRSSRGFNRVLPFIMGVLLFVGVIMGGQTLMTSTVEEKSSRVVEVLLAAVSPLQLMWGKLIGQLGVGLLVLGVYIGAGVFMLLQFAVFGLLDPMLILWVFVFFIVTYLVFGSLMLAIGAAVNQMADAQSLMGPVMLLMIVPYALTPMIGANPDSLLSVVLSFVPPLNTFIMLARMASSVPPPIWQVLVTLVIGVLAAMAAVWFAAKVFRIGLLMHGKPPNFRTLLRWARMA